MSKWGKVQGYEYFCKPLSEESFACYPNLINGEKFVPVFQTADSISEVRPSFPSSMNRSHCITASNSSLFPNHKGFIRSLPNWASSALVNAAMRNLKEEEKKLPISRCHLANFSAPLPFVASAGNINRSFCCAGSNPRCEINMCPA